MSNTVYEMTRTARPMGEFVAIEFAHVSSGEPVGPAKTPEERLAEDEARRDAQPQVTRCGLDGCDWMHDGTVGDGRDAARLHREEAHPHVAKAKRPRQRSFREQAIAARRSAFERSQDRPAVHVNPSASTTAEVRRDGAGGGATQTKEEETMAQRPRGFWTLENVVESFREHHRRTGSAPTTSLLGQTDRPDYLPAYPSMRKVGTYEEVLAAAGLERPAKKSASTRSSAAAAPKLAPVPEPEPAPEEESQPGVELEPAERHAPPGASPLVRLLSKLTPQDLEVAVDEIDQLRRRLDIEHALITNAIAEQAA